MFSSTLKKISVYLAFAVYVCSVKNWGKVQDSSPLPFLCVQLKNWGKVQDNSPLPFLCAQLKTGEKSGILRLLSFMYVQLKTGETFVSIPRLCR